MASQEGTQAQRASEPGLLVGDVLVRHPDLAGLDTAAEIFATDLAEADLAGPVWAGFWREAFGEAPPLPQLVRSELPDEGGFVLRPLGVSPEATANVRAALRPDVGRRVSAPSRWVHADLGFPEPTLVANELFAEVRYAMSPSMVQWLDFDDIREGTLRIFALPDFEGDVRLVTVVDEAAATKVVSDAAAAGGVQRKRLLQFLHAAAATPAAARWPTTADFTMRDDLESEAANEGRGDADGLFPHQRATVAWMRSVERAAVRGDAGAAVCRVEPLRFAGADLGTAYDVSLPRGGVVGHPPGSGKTRILATLVAESAPRQQDPATARTLIVCPPHLRKQWDEELALAGSQPLADVVDFDQLAAPSEPLVRQRPWGRLVVDEPQDCPGGMGWKGLQALAADMRAAGAAVWLLCGTAHSHLDTLGRLLLGHIAWHKASRQSEWCGCPEMSHLIRTRFVADPPWECLPMPELHISGVPVVLRPRESADAAVAALAGFVLDGVMLLSFGAEAAFAAAQERDELLLQMGWLGSVGAALLPATEHALADWECTVVQRSQQKLEELAEEIARLETDELQHAARYQFAGGDAALAPDLKFMAREAARVEVAGLPGSVGLYTEEACPAEWNALLGGLVLAGPLSHTPGAHDGHLALLPAPADGDFASAAAAAAASGASGVLFEADREEPRPFGYRHEQDPPNIPAAMISRALVARLRGAAADGVLLSVRLLISALVEAEGDREVDQGLVSAFLNDDVVDDALHRRLKGLRDERDRCERALRFARQMRALLEQNEAHCPVCFQSGEEAEAFAVMPDCFHVLCRGCLDRQVGYEPYFACPLCRTSIARLDVVVFRAAGADAGAGARDLADGNSRRQIAAGGNDGGVDSPVGRRETAGDVIGGGEVASVGEGHPSCDRVGGDVGVGDAGSKGGCDGAVAAGSGECAVGADAALAARGLRAEAVVSTIATNTARWEALPSKLQRLLGLVREVLASGPEERVLVFTQWAAHVEHLHEVFDQNGIETLSLVGELRQTMAALSRFGRPGEPRVLLLSSQRHSSGINLQAARHVVIVHPYCTPTSSSRESISRSQMLAFEAQAIGRVRRYPQRRPVHVHRLFAAGTIEEELYAAR